MKLGKRSSAASTWQAAAMAFRAKVKAHGWTEDDLDVAQISCSREFADELKDGSGSGRGFKVLSPPTPAPDHVLEVPS